MSGIIRYSDAAMYVLSLCPPYLPLRAVSKEVCNRDDLTSLLEEQLTEKGILPPPSGRPWHLRMAASTGNLAKLKLLLRLGTNPNTPVLQDDPVYSANICVPFIFEYGVTRAGPEDDEIILPPSKPLFAACICGHWNAVGVLLQAGACIEAVVAKRLHEEATLVLPLRKRTLAHLVQHRGLTALSGEDGNCGSLRSAKYAVEEARRTLEDTRLAMEAIANAITCVQEAMILDKSICLHNVLPFCSPNLPLRAVSREVCQNAGHTSLLERQLTEKGILPPPSSRAWHLRMAAASGNLAKLKMFLRFGTNPNTTVLQDDIFYCGYACFKRFAHFLCFHQCWAGATPEPEEAEVILPPSTPLFAACVCGRWNAVGELLQAGAVLEPGILACVLSLPKSQIRNRSSILSQVSRADVVAAMRLKEDCRRDKEDARRAEEVARRAEEDARRAEEDTRRAKEDSKRAKENKRRKAEDAKRAGQDETMQADVSPEENIECATFQAELNFQAVGSSQDIASLQEQEVTFNEAVPMQQHGENVKVSNESDELMSAIQRSRADVPTLSSDGVVLYKLTRMARLPEVSTILLESPLLLHCRKRVIEAGCEISPSWGSGAKFFVPFTPEQVADLEQAGFEIFDHHILALRSDKEVINEALKSLPRKRRPHVSQEHGTAKEFSVQRGLASTSSEDMEEDTGISIVEETSFRTDSSLDFAMYDLDSSLDTTFVQIPARSSGHAP